MGYLLATCDKQLGIALRMLYAERVQAYVETTMNDKGKIEFHVQLDVSVERFAQLEQRYKIMIS